MKKLLCILSAAILFNAAYIIFTNVTNKNNVCSTFDDYYTDRDANENCYYNPDYILSAPEVIRRHGYPLEMYNVTTLDGHILTLFRIPHGRECNTTERGKPVLIQHGFINNFASYIYAGQKSLGFILANEGYDVWMGNFRGTIYSKSHVNLSTSDSEYWNFTVHDYGVYDLPSLIDFVSNATNKKITYVGYSTGASAMFIYGTTYPKIATDKVEVIIALAPAVFPNAGGAYQILRMARYIWDKVYIPDAVLQYICFPYPFQMKLCYFLFSSVCGLHFKQLDPETLPSVLLHVRDVIPLKVAQHIAQFAFYQAFAQFSYDSVTNLKVYGTTNPPLYNLSNFNIGAYLVSGPNDVIVTSQSVKKLHNILPTKVNLQDVYVIQDEYFNHLDFIYDNNIIDLLYSHIVNLIKHR